MNSSFLQNRMYVILLLAGHTALFSCLSTSSQGWARPNNGKFLGNVRLGTIKTEKIGNSFSIEREIEDLLPLLMGERGLRLGKKDEKADFIVSIQAREREYSVDWRSERSLSIEVRLWPDDGTDTKGMPLAAGQVISRGNASLSSSKTLKRLLRLALHRVEKALLSTGIGIPEPAVEDSELLNASAGVSKE
jgi:hypothetical protein